MPRYEVIVTQYHSYEAGRLGLKEFYADMRRPIANTCYDEIDVEELDEE